MNTQANTAVRDYLDRMREVLSDLPATEVGEIMDDAGAHVAEVAEEMGGEFSTAALTERLGTPEAYARELRVAAGYPLPAEASTGAAAAGAGVALLARFALWSLVACTVLAFGFALVGGWRGVEEPQLLVALCAAVATLLVFAQANLLAAVAGLPETRALREALRRAETSDAGRPLASLRRLQSVWWVVRALLVAGGGVLVFGFSESVVIALALGVLTLVAGPQARADRRWLWISLPATGFALGVLLFILGSLVSRFDHRPSPVSYVPQPTLPSNVYVFDKDGKPLTDVYLYDEDGRPIDTEWYGCTGPQRDNRYPHPRAAHDGTGCREEIGVPFAAVIPRGSIAPTTTAPTTTAPGTPPSASTAPTATTQPTTTEPAATSPQPTAESTVGVVPTT